MSAQDDYYLKKAQRYQKEAEYYQKKAEGYRREAEYYLKKAEGYQREAAYYTKKGNLDRAESYSRYAERAMDESGSMNSIKKETIDSVNETIQTIRSAQRKNADQEHFVSLVTFNDDVKTVYDCAAAESVSELTGKTYCPDCCTALYDAIGLSLNALRPKVADNDRVLVTIVTDGEENSSKEYSSKAIKALVDELKEKEWVFAYIGANQDVIKVAATISITNTLSFDTTSEGTRAMSSRVNRSRFRFFSRLSSKDFDASAANENFFDEDNRLDV